MTTSIKNTNNKINKHTKVPLYQYGVLITKPWSQEMYDHNDRVADIVKQNLREALYEALLKFVGDPKDACLPKDDLYTIAKNICAYGWSNQSAEGIYNDAVSELERVQNYWLNSEYPDLVNAGLCPQVEPFFVGY